MKKRYLVTYKAGGIDYTAQKVLDAESESAAICESERSPEGFSCSGEQPYPSGEMTDKWWGIARASALEVDREQWTD